MDSSGGQIPPFCATGGISRETRAQGESRGKNLPDYEGKERSLRQVQTSVLRQACWRKKWACQELLMAVLHPTPRSPFSIRLLMMEFVQQASAELGECFGLDLAEGRFFLRSQLNAK